MIFATYLNFCHFSNCIVFLNLSRLVTVACQRDTVVSAFVVFSEYKSLVRKTQFFSPPLSLANKSCEILRMREIIYRGVSCWVAW